MIGLGDQAPTMLIVGYATFPPFRGQSVGLIRRREVGKASDNNSSLLFACWGDFLLMSLTK